MFITLDNYPNTINTTATATSITITTTTTNPTTTTTTTIITTINSNSNNNNNNNRRNPFTNNKNIISTMKATKFPSRVGATASATLTASDYSLLPKSITR